VPSSAFTGCPSAPTIDLGSAKYERYSSHGTSAISSGWHSVSGPTSPGAGPAAWRAQPASIQQFSVHTKRFGSAHQRRRQVDRGDVAVHDHAAVRSRALRAQLRAGTGFAQQLRELRVPALRARAAVLGRAQRGVEDRAGILAPFPRARRSRTSPRCAPRRSVRGCPPSARRRARGHHQRRGASARRADANARRCRAPHARIVDDPAAEAGFPGRRTQRTHS
jgi:hypothetical protein